MLQQNAKQEKFIHISFYSIITDYLFKPSISGLFGFSMFLTIIVISKFIGYLFSNVSSFQIDSQDINISLLGFLLLFLVDLLKNIHKNHSTI